MLAAISELTDPAPATPEPATAAEPKTQDNAEHRSGFLEHDSKQVRSTASETMRSMTRALDRDFLRGVEKAIDELRHAVKLDPHQAPPLAKGGARGKPVSLIPYDPTEYELSVPRSLQSTPVPEPYRSAPRARSWIGMMRFAAAVIVAIVVLVVGTLLTPRDIATNGHLDDRPSVASDLWGPPKSDDWPRERALKSAPFSDTIAGAAMSEQAPPAMAQKATPPIAQTVTADLVTRQLERDEVAALLKRGEDFIRSGDLASARLVLQRAVEAGDVHAALALAGTFDPRLLAKLDQDLAADVVMARFWYERAKQFGSAEAPQRLEQLESQVNATVRR
jgi:TPR repeat protein